MRFSGVTEGILSFGQKGEKAYGRKNFLELFSVFLSPPVFSVLHGRQELGFVDELTFWVNTTVCESCFLGGCAWVVNHIDLAASSSLRGSDGRQATISLEGWSL